MPILRPGEIVRYCTLLTLLLPDGSHFRQWVSIDYFWGRSRREHNVVRAYIHSPHAVLPPSPPLTTHLRKTPPRPRICSLSSISAGHGDYQWWKHGRNVGAASFSAGGGRLCRRLADRLTGCRIQERNNTARLASDRPHQDVPCRCHVYVAAMGAAVRGWSKRTDTICETPRSCMVTP